MIDYSKPRPTNSLLQFMLLWTVGLALLISVTGEPDELTAIAGRFVYWLIHIGAGLLITCFITRKLQNLGLVRPNVALQWVVPGLIGAIVFLPVSVFLELILPPSIGPDGHDDIVQDATGSGVIPAILSEFAALAPTFLIVWIIINLTYTLYTRDVVNNPSKLSPAPEPSAPEPSAQADKAAGIFAMLKPALGTDIVLLRSDLNYLHVHTTQGRTMFLYSLSRAAEELGDRGLLVHRSYWVAKEHVVRIRRQNRQYLCELTDKTCVPVSRRRQVAVIETFGSNFVRNQVSESGQ